MGLLKQLRRGIVLVTVGMTIGCQQVVPLPTPIPPEKGGFPPPTHPTLSTTYNYAKMSPAKREEIIRILLDYHALYDHYLKAVIATYQKKVYITSQDRRLMCRPDRFLKKVNLPPDLKVKDNGKYTDDELISILARYIKTLKTSIEMHNQMVDKSTAEYKMYCMSTVQ